MTTMILREWRARAALTQDEAYPRHFNTTVLPALRGCPGFLGASLGKQRQPGRIAFVVLTFWASLDAIHAFAGDDITHAVVEPAAIAALTDYDRTVRHYEIVGHIGVPAAGA